MKWNPIYEKELKIEVRTPRIILKILGYDSILAMIALIMYYNLFDLRTMYGLQSYSSILIIFLVLSVCQLGLVLFVIPASTAASISGERERQTLEILLSTVMKPSHIVIGKLASSISMLILLFLSSFPILAIVFSVGGITLFDLMELLILLVITAIYIGSIGIFFSVKIKRTIAATVASYAVVVALTIGTILAVLTQYQISGKGSNYGLEGIPLSSVYLLLLNPIFTLLSLINHQLGQYTDYINFLNGLGHPVYFITEHWFGISILLQLSLAMFFIGMSARALKKPFQ